MLLIPAVGSLYPVPAAPIRYFPYLYLAYLVAGILWIVAFRHRKPMAWQRIREDLDSAHAHYRGVGPAMPRS